jgi:hypothetical protein
MEQALQIEKTTYSVVDFLEWQRQGSLDLKPYYQRRAVWNPRVKSLLIDSMLRGYPLPLVFLHNRLDVKTSRSVRQVVDGQQRLRTILAFVDIDSLGPDRDEWDSFTVLRSHNREFAGLSFQQLSDGEQSRLLQTQLSVNVLPSGIDDVTILTIFQRMNSTGLKLNDQEIRNATFFGEFKESSYSLAYEQNQRWMRWGIFSRQEIAQMKEVEHTADLMGYLIRGVAARSKASITALYRQYDLVFEDRDVIEERFRDTFDLLEGVYEEVASRSGIKRFRSTAWSYVVFALVNRLGLKVASSQIVECLERAEVSLREDDLDEDLAKVLRGATADKSSREARINFLRQFV